MMQHFVYVLYSLKDNKLYKGYTSDIAKRLSRHNSGGNLSTAKRRPFILVYLESFNDKPAALKKEKYFKTLEGGAFLRQLLFEQGILNAEKRLNININH